MTEESVGKAVLDSAFHVHTQLGPGLLESVYEAAMVLDLRKKGFKVDQQRAIPVFFDGVKLEVGFRADLIVNDLVLVELKSVESVTPLFKKITLNYLRLVPLRLGFLINFNEEHLKHGLTRIVNGLEGKGTFRNPRNAGMSRDEREGCDVKPVNFSQPSPSSRTPFSL